jgi:hypothetical protein
MTRVEIGLAVRCVSLLAPAFVLVLSAQQTRDSSVKPASTIGTAALAGIVVTDEAASKPVRRVTVRLTDSVDARNSRVTVTDDAGRFAFKGVPAGRYTVNTSKVGYVPMAYGATRPNRPGIAIAIAEGERVPAITLKMLHGAVITGAVHEPDGQPARGATIGLFVYGWSANTGERSLVPWGAGRDATVDDRGIYRIYGLPPGDYVLAASSGTRATDIHPTTDADLQRAFELLKQAASNAPSVTPSPPPDTVGYAPVYYPGSVVAADATVISLKAGEERAGIDVSLQFVPTSRVDGTLRGLDGQAVAGAAVRMVNNAPAIGLLDAFLFMNTSSTTDRDGHFSFPGIPPGSYTLTVRTGGPAPGRGSPAPAVPPLWALGDVVVRGQRVTADLTLQPGMSVSGHLVIASGSATPAPDWSRARASLTAVVPTGSGAALGLASAVPDSSGQFTFAGVAPGRYRLTATVPGGTPTNPTWALKSSTVNGRDALDAPAEIKPGENPDDAVITMTDRPSELSGLMLDAAGQPAPEYFIIVFPAEKATWGPQSRRIQSMRPGRDGRFMARNLPPGAYLLAAVTDVEQGEWFDPTFLAKLVGAAIPVALADGEKKVQDIRIK